MPRRKPRNKGGRPCRYSARTVAVITAALARGGSLDEAAAAAAVGKATLYRWIALSRAGNARFAALADAVDALHRGSLSQIIDQLLAKAARGNPS
jgi:hypothetical protein